MLRNYLKVTLRTLRKHLTYSIINVIGLSIGLTGSLVIYSVLQYETNFDGFHTDADHIYRVVQNNHTADGVQYWNTTAYTVADALRNDFENIEVAQTAGPVQRVIGTNGAYGNRKFEIDKVLFVDENYLKMFDFRKAYRGDKPFWVQGDRSSAFKLAQLGGADKKNCRVIFS